MQQKSITLVITSIWASQSQKPTSHWMLLNDDLSRQRQLGIVFQNNKDYVHKIYMVCLKSKCTDFPMYELVA